jgi:hypothetical protein
MASLVSPAGFTAQKKLAKDGKNSYLARLLFLLWNNLIIEDF